MKHIDSSFRVWRFLSRVVLILCWTASAWALPSPDEIKACLNEPRSAECLDALYREALTRHSTTEALQQVERLIASDVDLRRACHPIVHAIGRETFRLKGNIHDSFSACNQTCHSGCYHGSVERFLRGDELYLRSAEHPSRAELEQKAATACDPRAPLRIRFQCLHGLGHALLFFSRYQLRPALAACDALPDDWSRNSCYGGVFMENVSSATPEKRDLSPSDPHYPCNAVEPRYRSQCYLMQTSRMAEMGLSTPLIFEECAKAGAYRFACTLSIGRDLSNEVRLGESKAVARRCEAAAGDDRLACVRGVVFALIDDTWDGRYALPFCASLTTERDQIGCIHDSLRYLKDGFGKSTTEVADECSRHLDTSARCLELAGL